MKLLKKLFVVLYSAFFIMAIKFATPPIAFAEDRYRCTACVDCGGDDFCCGITYSCNDIASCVSDELTNEVRCCCGSYCEGWGCC
ncbi:MAG: hypothetical protein ACTSPQ_21055 [Candidatus Helarchaeota archaeon]